MKYLSIVLMAMLLWVSPAQATIFKIGNGVAATGKSAGIKVDTWRYKTLSVVLNSGTATVKMEMADVDVDGAYVQIGSDITADGRISTDNAAGFIRYNVTACAACDIDIYLVTTN